MPIILCQHLTKFNTFLKQFRQSLWYYKSMCSFKFIIVNCVITAQSRLNFHLTMSRQGKVNHYISELITSQQLTSLFVPIHAYNKDEVERLSIRGRMFAKPEKDAVIHLLQFESSAAATVTYTLCSASVVLSGKLSLLHKLLYSVKWCYKPELHKLLFQNEVTLSYDLRWMWVICRYATYFTAFISAQKCSLLPRYCCWCRRVHNSTAFLFLQAWYRAELCFIWSAGYVLK